MACAPKTSLTRHDPTIRDEIHRGLGGECNKLGCPVIRVGGVADHVQIMCHLARAISVMDLIKDIKRGSSQWIKPKSLDLADFYWQKGYSAFFISPSHVPDFCAYVANQEEHHRTKPFQDEFRRLLTKYGLEYQPSASSPPYTQSSVYLGPQSGS